MGHWNDRRSNHTVSTWPRIKGMPEEVPSFDNEFRIWKHIVPRRHERTFEPQRISDSRQFSQLLELWVRKTSHEEYRQNSLSRTEFQIQKSLANTLWICMISLSNYCLPTDDWFFSPWWRWEAMIIAHLTSNTRYNWSLFFLEWTNLPVPVGCSAYLPVIIFKDQLEFSQRPISIINIY